MSNVKGKIENWMAVYDNKNIDVHFHIKGEMNGSPIHTSRVIKIKNNIATTRNNQYELGFPLQSINEEYNDYAMPSDSECELWMQKHNEMLGFSESDRRALIIESR